VKGENMKLDEFINTLITIAIKERDSNLDVKCLVSKLDWNNGCSFGTCMSDVSEINIEDNCIVIKGNSVYRANDI
jgi:hypothetical protein